RRAGPRSTITVFGVRCSVFGVRSDYVCRNTEHRTPNAERRTPTMGTAYTPGLAVSADATIRKTRRLPLKGTVIVREGDVVEPQTVVARAEIPGILRTVRAAEILGVDPDEVPKTLEIRQGDSVSAGQTLAKSSSFFGLFKSECRS